MVFLMVAAYLGQPASAPVAGVLVLAQAVTDSTSGIPGIAQTGVVGALLTFLWWHERADRKAAEERERCVIRDAAERLSAGINALKDVADVVKGQR